MEFKPGFKAAWLTLAAVVGMSFVAVAGATPVVYNFTVNITSGPLEDTSSSGMFSYDGSSVDPGNTITGTSFLTGFDFALNGITYDATRLKASSLTFNSAGDLVAFQFGTLLASSAWPIGTNNWRISSAGDPTFSYSIVPPRHQSLGRVYPGEMTYALATVAVPEPAVLGIFGAGILLVGLFVGLRRRGR